MTSKSGFARQILLVTGNLTLGEEDQARQAEAREDFESQGILEEDVVRNLIYYFGRGADARICPQWRY